jgi:hypothetical protein
MKPALPVIFTLLVLFSCQSPKVKDHDRIEAAVNQQLKAYPAETLTDIYKSFYQDDCGPGHLLEDTAAARDYMIYELNEMNSHGRHQAEPCGLGTRFVRVPLDLVKDSLIDPAAFFNAFLGSATAFIIPDPIQWGEQWHEILDVVESMDLNLPNFEEDKKQLEDLLYQGKAVVHHSKIYSDSYDPHYRIMTREKWQELSQTSH